jgi:hypothetical protein
MATKCTPLTGLNTAALPWATRTAQSFEGGRASGDLLKVRFGQKTFDAEGVEERGRFFSRKISVPPGNSGVTIGRGYDMRERSASQIVRELTFAGMAKDEAVFLSKAARKQGDTARTFVCQYGDFAPEMSLEVQKKLFEDVTTPEMVNDIKRIFNKPDTVAAYGRPSWDSLSPAAQELVFDLRYRGDYTPTTRKRIQKLLVNQDYKALKEVMDDTAYWQTLKVPEGRIEERQKMAQELLSSVEQSPESSQTN